MEKLNIAEILKDYPKGMELDCTMYDNVQLNAVMDRNIYPIKIQTPDGIISLTKDGCYSLNTHSKCIIFPKGKTTWEGFQRPFKDGDVVTTKNKTQIFIFKEDIVYVGPFYKGMCYFGVDLEDGKMFKKGFWNFTRLATEEEKEKLFKAIKDNGYKWNAETTTLEKLKKEKFDISTLKPFESRVLVRSFGNWEPAIWGYYSKEYVHPFIVVGGNLYLQCIPYESNEHLLGTTNDCDDYYKTWE